MLSTAEAARASGRPIPLRDWSLRELWFALRNRWATILACVGASLLVALAVLRFATPVYAVSMVVGPKTTGLTQTADASLAQQLLGTLGPQRAAPFEIYTQLLTSNAVARRLTENHHIDRRIWMRQWDERGQQWIEPSGVTAAVLRAIKAVIGWPQWQPPTPNDVADFLAKSVRLETTRSGLFAVSSIYRIRMRSADPALAVDILRLLHREADGSLRDDRIKELDTAIAYLETKLQNTTIVTTQEALSDVLASLIRERILLIGDTSYAAVMIDAPVIPKRPSFPNPRLLLPGGLLLGLLVGLVLALFLEKRAVDRRSASARKPDATRATSVDAHAASE